MLLHSLVKLGIWFRTFCVYSSGNNRWRCNQMFFSGRWVYSQTLLCSLWFTVRCHLQVYNIPYDATYRFIIYRTMPRTGLCFMPFRSNGIPLEAEQSRAITIHAFYWRSSVAKNLWPPFCVQLRIMQYIFVTHAELIVNRIQYNYLYNGNCLILYQIYSLLQDWWYLEKNVLYFRTIVLQQVYQFINLYNCSN